MAGVEKQSAEFGRIPKAKRRKATGLKDGEFEQGLDVLAQRPDSEAPIIGGVSRLKRPKLTQAEQSAEFERVAREHGAEGDERSFDEALTKLAKPKSRP